MTHTEPDNPTRQSPYDLVVIGAGMIGASAARHAAEAGIQVAIVGAPEPVDRSTAETFGSHYDAGRITRIVDADPVWSELATASISRYSDMQQRSGITFHTPAGLAWIKPAEVSAPALAHSLALGSDAAYVSSQWMRERFGIALPERLGDQCVYEGPPAGHIDPRALVRAQLTLAMQAGAVMIANAVTAVTRSGDKLGVQGPFGEVTARQVLLATGAYGARLVGVDLDVVRWPRSKVRLDIAHPFALPALIAEQVDEPGLEHVYWVPPVQFPDGVVGFTIGGVHESVQPFSVDDDLVQWFRGTGSSPESAALRSVVHRMLPGVTVHSWDVMPCVITRTASDYPYIGWIDDGVAVAVGGNGAAAKSCDEIGRQAASLFADKIEPADLALFAPVVRK